MKSFFGNKVVVVVNFGIISNNSGLTKSEHVWFPLSLMHIPIRSVSWSTALGSLGNKINVTGWASHLSQFVIYRDLMEYFTIVFEFYSTSF